MITMKPKRNRKKEGMDLEQRTPNNQTFYVTKTKSLDFKESTHSYQHAMHGMFEPNAPSRVPAGLQYMHQELSWTC